jgi:predicted metal-binding protein
MSKEISFEFALEKVQKIYPGLQGIEIDSKDLIFEERVKMSCFYCARYNNNWKCPPKIPPIDYEKMLAEYEHCAMVWLKMPVTQETFEDVRIDSSVTLHKALLEMERLVLLAGNSTCLSFIGGSCKLCKNGCGKERCSNPYKARTPVEAIGVNIVKSAQRNGLNIAFPVQSEMVRISLLLW